MAFQGLGLRTGYSSRLTTTLSLPSPFAFLSRASFATRRKNKPRPAELKRAIARRFGLNTHDNAYTAPRDKARESNGGSDTSTAMTGHDRRERRRNVSVNDTLVWGFYKPRLVESTWATQPSTPSDPRYQVDQRETLKRALKKASLLHKIPVPQYLVAIGRLDLMSEGLLLLTNNPTLADRAMRPRTDMKRTYRVRIHGNTDQLESHIMALGLGITVNDTHYAPIEGSILGVKGPNAWIELILTEGKNREIRNIMNHFGFSVSQLIRTTYGPYYLKDMVPGDLKVWDLKPQFKELLETQ